MVDLSGHWWCPGATGWEDMIMCAKRSAKRTGKASKVHKHAKGTACNSHCVTVVPRSVDPLAEIRTPVRGAPSGQ
jgi:hypothetical protein